MLNNFLSLPLTFESERALGIHSNRCSQRLLLGELSNRAERCTALGYRVSRFLPVKFQHLGKVHGELSQLRDGYPHLSGMVRGR
jgi:hypothetical protein